MNSTLSSHAARRSPGKWIPRGGANRRQRVVLRGFGYAGAGYSLTLAVATRLSGTLAGGETHFGVEVAALAPILLASGGALVGALIGLWPYRHLRLGGEDKTRHRSAAIPVAIGAGVTLVVDGAISSISVLLIGAAALVIMKLALVTRTARRHRSSSQAHRPLK